MTSHADQPIKNKPGFFIDGPFANASFPYGKATMHRNDYYVKGEGGIAHIINFHRRGDFYVVNFFAYCQRGKYFKRLGNAINQAIIQIREQNGRLAKEKRDNLRKRK